MPIVSQDYEIKIKYIDPSILMLMIMIYIYIYIYIHDPVVQISFFLPRLYARSFYLSKVDEKLLKKFNSKYGGAFKAHGKYRYMQ